MAKFIELQYGVVFGKCDASDWIPYDYELDEQEEEIYNRALASGEDLNEIEELEEIRMNAYAEIEAIEIGNCIDAEDEYVMECQGLLEVDPDYINDLVAKRDPYTLEFFHLEGLSEDELEEWDANEEEMPLVKEFEKDFEPYSPFEEGWILNVEFVNPDEDEDDE